MNNTCLVFEDHSAMAGVPSQSAVTQWVEHVLRKQLDTPALPEINLQVVDEASISELNATYRNKTGPTNVLSFPFEAPPGLPAEQAQQWLGDIVICAPVVAREAQAQNKTLQAHWAHMVVHGVLHLLGYDHQQDKQAEIMESLEIDLLRELGFPNPYLETQAQA